MAEFIAFFGGHSLGFLALLFGFGAAVGLLGGFFGVGGGWIITPTLNILGMDMGTAVGTGFGYIMGMSLVSAYKHRQRGNIDLILGLVIGITMIVGIQFGKAVIMVLEKGGNTGPVVRILYIVLLFGLGSFMLKDALSQPREASGPGGGQAKGLQRIRLRPLLTLPRSGIEISLWPLVAIGLTAGFLSGILGVGGGFMLMPIMVYLLGVPTLVAVGTSLICLVVASPFGTLAYAMAGRIDFAAVAVMVLGACVGAPIGVGASRHLHGSRLRLLYAVMTLLGGASVVLRQLDLALASRAVILGAVGGMCALIMAMTVIAKKEAQACADNAGF